VLFRTRTDADGWIAAQLRSGWHTYVLAFREGGRWNMEPHMPWGASFMKAIYPPWSHNDGVMREYREMILGWQSRFDDGVHSNVRRETFGKAMQMPSVQAVGVTAVFASGGR
jgi:hypothetical protein